MGEAFYDYLFLFFSSGHNQHVAPDRIVSSALSNIGMFVAYMWLTGTLLWFTRKSVLISRTPLVYLFAAFIGLCGVSHLGHVLRFPDWLQLVVEFLATIVSLYTAYITFRQRHFILSVVFQFKYVIGLIKTFEKIDE